MPKLTKKTKKLLKKSRKIKKKLLAQNGFNPDCVDCGVDTHRIRESYMVHNRVWKKAGMGKGRLCVGCIEERLGRKLTCRDFFMVGLNIDAYIYPHAASKRLRKRLHSLS